MFLPPTVCQSAGFSLFLKHSCRSPAENMVFFPADLLYFQTVNGRGDFLSPNADCAGKALLTSRHKTARKGAHG